MSLPLPSGTELPGDPMVSTVLRNDRSFTTRRLIEAMSSPGRALGASMASLFASKTTPIEQVIFPPATAATEATGESPWYGANYATLMRFQVQQPFAPARVALACGVASGNIEVAIFSVTRNVNGGYDVAKVVTSGVIACPTPGVGGAQGSQILVPFATAPVLPPGQYALGLWVDNTTATFAHVLTNQILRGAQGLGFGSTSTGGMPAAGVSLSPSGRAFMASIDSVIPTRPGAVLLGDSITASQGWFSLANAQAGTKYNLLYNAGVAGQQSAAILARVNTDVISRNPNLVTVLAGTNDIGAGANAAAAIDPAPIIANIKSIVSQLTAGTSATIILCTVPPRNYSADQTPLGTSAVAALNAVNTAIRGLASSRVKIADWSVALSTGDGVTPNLAYYVDHVHPLTPAGAQVMAGVLQPLL